MTPSSAVKVRLLAITSLTTLINQRVWVDVLQQGHDFDKGPAIRVQCVGEIEDAHLRGAKAIRRARVQVDSVAKSLEVASAVSEAAHGDGAGSGLSGFEGDVSGQLIMAILPLDVRSDYSADELKQWRVSRDYMVWLR